MNNLKKLSKQQLIFLILGLIALATINTLFIPSGFLRGVIFGLSIGYLMFSIITLVKKIKNN